MVRTSNPDAMDWSGMGARRKDGLQGPNMGGYLAFVASVKVIRLFSSSILVEEHLEIVYQIIPENQLLVAL